MILPVLFCPLTSPRLENEQTASHKKNIHTTEAEAFMFAGSISASLTASIAERITPTVINTVCILLLRRADGTSLSLIILDVRYAKMKNTKASTARRPSARTGANAGTF